jgi:hypothetical protein
MTQKQQKQMHDEIKFENEYYIIFRKKIEKGDAHTIITVAFVSFICCLLINLIGR